MKYPKYIPEIEKALKQNKHKGEIYYVCLSKIVKILTAKVDGKKIKADTWYKAENGKFVEVE